jgi:hypothetical protein
MHPLRNSVHIHILRETDRRVCVGAKWAVLVRAAWDAAYVHSRITHAKEPSANNTLARARVCSFGWLDSAYSESLQSRAKSESSAIAVYAPSENTHIIIIFIIRRNFNNQSLPLLTTATAASLLVNYYKKRAQHPQIETMRRAHKTNRPKPKIAKSSTDARTKTHAEHFRLCWGKRQQREREREREENIMFFSALALFLCPHNHNARSQIYI